MNSHVLAAAALAALVALSACSTGQTLAQRPPAETRDAAAPVDAAARTVEFALPPPGVPDRGRAAGLVVIEVGVSLRCSAALVTSNVAIAPARCVARSGCGPLPPAALTVRTSDEAREPLGAVLEVVGPSGGDYCDEGGLAAVLLASQSDGLAPLAVRARPAAAGEFVRFVGLSGERTLRDHLRVEGTTRSQLQIAGDSCVIASGAIAVDELTGELLGVGASPRGPCDHAAVTLVQLDAVRALVATAVERAAAPRFDEDGGVVDGGMPRRGKAVRPTLDLGDPCAGAEECAAGVCVLEAGAATGYCSRTCGPGDRCPLSLRCERVTPADRAAEGPARSACVRSS